MTFRSALAGAVLLFSAVPVVAGTVTVACAAEGNRAVLVVDTGDAAYRYCVSFSESSVSGIELIRLAGEQHGLQYSFGFGGQAVCQLQGVGPEGDDCFAEDPYFWGYWHGTSSGGWTWSSTGAASYRVEDGDVEGWSWGTGQSGDTHQQPPVTPFGSVCPAPSGASGSGDSSEPKSSGKKPGSKGSKPGNVAIQVSPAASPSPSEPPPERRRSAGKGAKTRVRRKAPEVVASPSILEQPVQEQAAAPASDEGPSPAALAAVVAALGFVAAGGVIARRRKT